MLGVVDMGVKWLVILVVWMGVFVPTLTVERDVSLFLFIWLMAGFIALGIEFARRQDVNQPNPR